MTLEEALKTVGNTLGNVDETLSQGLPDGVNSEWGYDEKLVIEIGEACGRWRLRRFNQTFLEGKVSAKMINPNTGNEVK